MKSFLRQRKQELKIFFFFDTIFSVGKIKFKKGNKNEERFYTD